MHIGGFMFKFDLRQLFDQIEEIDDKLTIVKKKNSMDVVVDGKIPTTLRFDYVDDYFTFKDKNEVLVICEGKKWGFLV